MSKARTALLKRRVRSLDIDGETVYYRSPTLREAAEIDKMEGEEMMRFVVTTCLCEEDGTLIFSGKDDDSYLDLPVETVGLVADAINNSGKVTVKGAEKNSDAAQT